ncbi:putative hipA domain-containing protein [Acinetobacter baumannii 1571545]|nr:putative hipA domain-containing protein [Acinetobacter baumannii 1571545]
MLANVSKGNKSMLKNLMFTTMDGVNIGFGVPWSPQPQSQVGH